MRPGFLILIGYSGPYVPRTPILFDELRVNPLEAPIASKRVCCVCSREFTPKTRYAVACSPGCRREATRRLDEVLRTA